MTRQKLAEQTATINDAGNYIGAGGSGALWSDSFSYDTRSNLTQRIDARGVKTNFNYLKSGSPDPLNRLQGITFDKVGADTTHGTIHEAANITYNYMTAGDKERIYTAASAGVSTETYTYDVEGRVSNYKMSLTGRTSYPMDTSYLYDTANRLTEVRYPAQYGMSGNPRKTVNVTYDQTSRLKDLKVSGVTQMDQIAYNDFGQATSIRIGGGAANPLTEQYSFDANTGLMTNQKVKRGSTSLMDLTYSYARDLSKGSLNGTTGNLTKIVNNLDRNKDRKYEYDTLGRLIKAKGGVAAGGSGVANWNQTYTYDRYGNKKTTAKSGVTANSAAIPLDGLASQAYAVATNRITTAGHEYDNAGNMTRGKAPDGSLQRFEYDEAGRIKIIKTDAGAAIETNTYATSRERLKKEAGTTRTYYAWGGSSVLAEHVETGSETTMKWSKSYVYAGSRLLSTATKNGSTEKLEYHHPDRLGTKMVSDPVAANNSEQATLPFGTEITAETQATTNQRFTSYDRSGATGLDYAVNRTYNSGQSRFTQVDPIGMASTNAGDPQSLNLFAYVANDPIGFTDPTGLYSQAPEGTAGGGCRYIPKEGEIGDPIDDGVHELVCYNEKGERVSFTDYIIGRFEKNQKDCDKRLGRVFGGVIATAFEPNGLVNPDGSPSARAGHNRIWQRYGNTGELKRIDKRESPTNGNAHQYANAQGTGDANAIARTPSGFTGNPVPYIGDNRAGNEATTQLTFNYNEGSLSQYGYAGGLSIVFVHTGSTTGTGNNVRLLTLSGGTVGVIGNYGRPTPFESGGGSLSGFFTHNHLIFYARRNGKRGKRIDPRSVFCSDLGF